MNAVIYARYSSEGQREESIDGQLRECIEYCKQNSMTVVKEYIDRALSAKTEPFPEKRTRKHRKKRNESVIFCGMLVHAT